MAVSLLTLGCGSNESKVELESYPAAMRIRRGKWRVFMMYAWESGAYVLPEFQVLTNYLTGNNDVYVAPELGYSHQGTTMYVKPGVGINPDQNDRDWGLEFGFRVQF